LREDIAVINSVYFEDNSTAPALRRKYGFDFLPLFKKGVHDDKSFTNTA